MRKQKYFDLLRELVIADFKLKYQGSVGGYLWSLLKPVGIFGILYVVFSFFVKIGASLDNYALYLLIGVFFWNYFAEATSTALTTVVNRESLVKKVYFPPLLLVLASNINSFINLALGLIVVTFFMFVTGVTFSMSWFLVFILMAELVIFVFGISMLLSALYVKFRDFSHIWELSTQALFYASPIIYPVAIVPLRFQEAIMMNPLAQIFQDIRGSLLGAEVTTVADVSTLPLILVPHLIVVASFGLGFYAFRRQAPYFAENV